jgi:hypothetical protein
MAETGDMTFTKDERRWLVGSGGPTATPER